MSDVALLNLADELTKKLVSLTSLPAKRKYRLLVDREKLKELICTVFPDAEASAVLNRGDNENAYQINVVIQAPVENLDDVEQIDGLVAEVAKVKALFDEDGALRDEELAGCQWTAIENAPLWDPDRLLSTLEFLSIVKLSYRET
jgi:prophage DNA circulation protein